MEVPDTTVRVLFDFEYKTKDGREIKIKCGERLFLIKKTNHDWWQVIRSFERRPFYVPASYVEEIQRNKTASVSSDGGAYKFKKNIAITNLGSESDNFVQHQSLQHLQSASVDASIHKEKAYRNRSFSLEDKRVSNYSTKENSSKTHFSTLSSSGYESLSEIGLPGVVEQSVVTSQENLDYVNLRREGDGFIIEELDIQSSRPSEYETAANSGEPVITDKDSLLSSSDNSFQGTISNELNKIEIDNDEIGNYSNVSCVSDSVQNQKSPIGRDLISKLPLSSSLEELAQQIELKTNKLRKCPDFTKIFNSLESSSVLDSYNEEGDVSKSMLNPAENKAAIDVATKVKNLNRSEDPGLSFVGLSKKLQYAGSFKTKLERQKWAKQHFDHSSLKHVVEDEQMKSESKVNIDQEDQTNNITSININFSEKVSSVAIIESLSVAEESVQKEANTSQIKKEKFYKDDMASKQKSGSRQSLDSIVEDEDSFNIPSKSEDFEDKLSKKKIEDPKPSVSINIKPPEFEQSDKGSTDSLLDIDKHFNSRKESVGTTSDGEDLYLDNSDSETDSIILGMTRLKNSADDVRKNQKRKISLTRNRRVDSCKNRQYPMQAPPSPTPAQIPTRTLSEGWNEYITDDGRKYFFNSQTRAKSWKPPRRRYNSNEEKQDENGSTGNLYSGSSSPLAEVDGVFANLPLPAGWHSEVDQETGLPCYISITTGAKVSMYPVPSFLKAVGKLIDELRRSCKTLHQTLWFPSLTTALMQ